MKRWNAGFPEWKTLVAEFEGEPDMRDWELKEGSNPDVKKRVELAFMWMATKYEIISSVMPMRIFEYFEKGENERKVYKAHSKRVSAIIEKLSRLHLCPRKIREGHEGADVREQREIAGVAYRLDKADGPLAGGKYGRLDADQRLVPRD